MGGWVFVFHKDITEAEFTLTKTWVTTSYKINYNVEKQNEQLCPFLFQDRLYYTMKIPYSVRFIDMRKNFISNMNEILHDYT